MMDETVIMMKWLRERGRRRGANIHTTKAAKTQAMVVRSKPQATPTAVAE